MKTEDKRIIKTKLAIKYALINLLKEKSFDKIKVKDVCEAASIDRATFYSHYQDKFHCFHSLLLDDFYNEIVLKTSLEYNFSSNKEYYLKVIELCLDFLEDHRDLIFTFIMLNKESSSRYMVTQAIENVVKRLLFDNKQLYYLPIDIYSDFMIASLSGVVFSWAERKNNYSKSEILEFLTKIIDKNLVSN